MIPITIIVGKKVDRRDAVLPPVPDLIDEALDKVLGRRIPSSPAVVGVRHG